jgi:antitoxin component YwqK of YwqJK toxin-antitoxin module
MNKYTALVVFACLLFNNIAQAADQETGKIIRKDEDGHKIEEYTKDANGTLQGVYIKYHNWYHADEKEQKAEQYTYVDGKIDGQYQSWTDDGKKLYVGNYKNDEKSGTWSRYENDSISSSRHYKNDIQDGDYIVYFPGTKVIKSKTAFKVDQKNGRHIVYHYPEDDSDAGAPGLNDEGDELIAVEGEYLNNKENGDWTWKYKNGHLKMTKHYTNTVQDQAHIIYFRVSPDYPKGKQAPIEESTAYKNNVKNGKYEKYEWRKDGTRYLAVRGQHLDNHRSGEWVWFYPSNNYKLSANHNKKGLKHGEWIWYDDVSPSKSQRSRVRNYKDNSPHGDWIWYTNGVESHRQRYQDGFPE